jgi:dephospho-CoA kinase
VARILITGMSGTGKSSALAELERRGFQTVDMDSPGWSTWVDSAEPYGGEWLWREDRVTELLAHHHEPSRVVSGCASNQGQFYDRFDAVVLLSAPPDVVVERIARRTTNDYGKRPDERDRILADLAEVEPLLRATCTHELDASRPLAEVVEALAAIVRDPGARRRESGPADQRTPRPR